jgi:DNA-binding transcriptional MerR regulator
VPVADDGFTIGEVLNQLKEDFEDITISKIRFLESEGLIYPDRTESGYRKFTDDDVDRLRFILTAQRDHYLPLKVIREQLERLDAGEAPQVAPGAAGARGNGAATGDGDATASPQHVAELAARALEALAAGDAALLEVPPPLSLALREFCEATALEATQVRALREFGIIGERGNEAGPFDADDVIAARAARELLKLGLEPRHLRMYAQFVDRELALFEQLVTPLLRQRNPEARRQATRQLEQLATLTGALKRSLLAHALRGYVHGA